MAGRKKNRSTQIDDVVREVRHLRSQIRTSASFVTAKVEGGVLGRKRVMGGHGIIADIHKHGPKTMPELLKDRAYSRQYLHEVIKRLQNEGLVKYQENPNNKRSMLIVATDKGIRHMLERRQVVLDTVVPHSMDLSDEEFETTMKVLRVLRVAFQNLCE